MGCLDSPGLARTGTTWRWLGVSSSSDTPTIARPRNWEPSPHTCTQCRSSQSSIARLPYLEQEVGGLLCQVDSEGLVPGGVRPEYRSGLELLARLVDLQHNPGRGRPAPQLRPLDNSHTKLLHLHNGRSKSSFMKSEEYPVLTWGEFPMPGGRLTRVLLRHLVGGVGAAAGAAVLAPDRAGEPGPDSVLSVDRMR